MAILNDDPERFRRTKTSYLERHNETDEVFVLLEGECALYIGDGTENTGDIELQPMERTVLYNAKKEVWHNLIAASGMKLLIVENADTSKDNSGICYAVYPASLK